MADQKSTNAPESVGNDARALTNLLRSSLKMRDGKYLLPSDVVSFLGGKKGMIKICRQRLLNQMHEAITLPVANRISELKVSSEWTTQTELAEILGMSDAELSQFESRADRMAVDKLLELAVRLGVQIETLSTEVIQDSAIQCVIEAAIQIRREAGCSCFQSPAITSLNIASIVEFAEDFPLMSPDEIQQDAQSLQILAMLEDERVTSIARATGISPTEVAILAADLSAILEHVRPVLPVIIILCVLQRSDTLQADEDVPQRDAVGAKLTLDAAVRLKPDIRALKSLMDSTNKTVIQQVDALLRMSKDCDDSSSELWLCLAATEFCKCDYREAISLCSEGLMRWPNERAFLVRRANCRFCIGDEEGAVEDLEAAIEPPDLSLLEEEYVWYLLETYHRVVGNVERAEFFRRAISMFGDN